MQVKSMINEFYSMRKKAKEEKSKTSMQAYNACIDQILYVDNQIEGYRLFYIRIRP